MQATLEATQGQMDGFFSQLPYKCHQNRVASVGVSLKICPWVTSRVAATAEFSSVWTRGRDCKFALEARLSEESEREDGQAMGGDNVGTRPRSEVALPRGVRPSRPDLDHQTGKVCEVASCVVARVRRWQPVQDPAERTRRWRAPCPHLWGAQGQRVRQGGRRRGWFPGSGTAG